jgi:hypothetical protein
MLVMTNCTLDYFCSGVKKENGNFSVQLKKTTICKAFFSSNIYKRSPFLFGCLLFRRCSLSFRNLLSCHTVSRVCHCQSYSDEQSANIDYGILETLGVFSRRYKKSCFVYMQDGTTRYRTTRSHSQKRIHLSISISSSLDENKENDDTSTNCQQE